MRNPSLPMPKNNKQYIVYGYLRRFTEDHYIDLFDIILSYYRNPLLYQKIADALRKRYNAKYASHFIEYVNKQNVCLLYFIHTYASLNVFLY